MELGCLFTAEEKHLEAVKLFIIWIIIIEKLWGDFSIMACSPLIIPCLELLSIHPQMKVGMDRAHIEGTGNQHLKWRRKRGWPENTWWRELKKTGNQLGRSRKDSPKPWWMERIAHAVLVAMGLSKWEPLSLWISDSQTISWGEPPNWY